MSDISRAERALHRRTALACEAATAAGVPGQFRVWEQDEVLAVLATDPALTFLSTVTGPPAKVIALINTPIWHDITPTVLVTDPDAVPRLQKAGLAPKEDRILATRTLSTAPTTQPDIIAANEQFPEILLAGYEVTGPVAEFIRAEHQHPTVKRYLAIAEDKPIAAAAMTIHGDVAVLGGASTLRAHRGKGAQSRLLRHRIRVAVEAGCTLAVATASAKSTSAANLQRAGFTLHQQQRWTPRPGR